MKTKSKAIKRACEFLRGLLARFAPPPSLTVSQWADRFRFLSPEASAEPGRWDTARVPYMREVMDCANDHDVKRVAIMKASQIAYTEVILNIIGYFIDYDPAPMLCVQPNTTPMAESFSKERLDPMIRDCPSLREKVSDQKSRDSGNTILHKKFKGGHLSLTGANAPSGLATRPIRVLLFDETDRYDVSAGGEGDPISIAEKRTTTFWNKVIYMGSSPTRRGQSRIEAAYEASDKRIYKIPCPACGAYHHLQFGNVRWDNGDPLTARYICPACAKEYTDAAKNEIVASDRGRWEATAPFTGTAGFHIPGFLSPWKPLSEIVEEFLKAKNDPVLLQVWTNTVLGETFEESGEVIDESAIFGLSESYPAEVPGRGLILTIGADVQPDRIEAETVAWGGGEESWSIDYSVFYGDPDIKEGSPGSVWDAFSDYRRRVWKHETGIGLTAHTVCIDSGGANTQAVYDYARHKRGERVFAVKGRDGQDLPIVAISRRRYGKKTARPVDLYIVGVDQIKRAMLARLRMESPGPGYMHFPKGRDLEYFRQLTAERLITKYRKGFKVLQFHKISGRRNEALDCRVYATAALSLASPQFAKLAYRIKERAKAEGGNVGGLNLAPPEKAETAAAAKSAEELKTSPVHNPEKRRRNRIRSSYLDAWR